MHQTYEWDMSTNTWEHFLDLCDRLFTVGEWSEEGQSLIEDIRSLPGYPHQATDQDLVLYSVGGRTMSIPSHIGGSNV